MIEFVAPVRLASPCVNVCRLGADHVCEGCGRTRDEIARWTSMGDAARDAVMARLAGTDQSGKRVQR